MCIHSYAYKKSIEEMLYIIYIIIIIIIIYCICGLFYFNIKY